MMDMSKCLHDLYSDQAHKSPSKTAVVDIDGTSLTFEELDRKTDVVAKRLKQYGCKTDSVVGIYMEKCMEYTIAYIAALKANGCYLPIDYSYPTPMLNAVLTDSMPVAVVTLSKYKNWLPEDTPIICLDDDWENRMSKIVENVSLSEHARTSSLDDLAYIVYSSGTTGAPKGIMCPHRGAVISYAWRHNKYPFEEDERVACNIFFVWEMLRPLLKGCTLYIIPDNVIYDPTKLLAFLQENKITRVLLTPSLLQVILDDVGADVTAYFKNMKIVWLCGEVVTMSLRNRFIDLLPDVQLLNLYSVSECHDITASDLSKGKIEMKHGGDIKSRKFCPVGKVMDGVHIAILNDKLERLPIGIPGEIYVGGPTLARGYLNREELTAYRFIDTPADMKELYGSKLYRTGDWGYMLSNGELEICGRCDSMVKIRGYTVELQAVEAALLELQQMVNACKVQVHGEEGDDKFLVAYVVPGDNVTKYDIHAALKAKLPRYMIPSFFVMLTSLPVTTVGKLDTKLLPRFDGKQQVEMEVEGNPKSETEVFLHETWKEILHLKRVDIDENFFDIGGHSLLAARMLSIIREKYNIDIEMLDIFTNSTIVLLASFIDLKTGTITGRRGSIDIEVDLSHEVEYHNQSFINMDMMLRAFWRSCQYAYRWMTARVFLTGATGFLGAFLLKEVLKSTKAHVYCLVREIPDICANNRLRENLIQYGILPTTVEDEATDEEKEEREKILTEYEKRVTVLTGDVSILNFGLTHDDYAYLSYEIDFIIHAAAVVNMIYPYKALHGANVVGTQNVMLFAGSSKIKPVYYISTDAVFPPNHTHCNEDTSMTEFHKDLSYGYAQSKWVAEQLVLRAGKQGLPTAIFRLGNMSGDSKKAYWNKSDFNLMFMQACIRNGSAPITDFKFEMTPVDFACHVIVSLTEQISLSVGKIYHIINTKPIDSKLFFESLSNYGYPLSIIPFEAWKERVEANTSSDEDSSAKKVLHVLHSMKNPVVEDKRIFSSTNLVEYLRKYLKTKYQFINTFLLKNYMDQLSYRGIIPKPQISNPVLPPLTNCVAIVTGASSGIGEAIAKHLAENGASVVLAARRVEKLEEIRNQLVKKGYIVAAFKVDVTCISDVKALVEQTEDMFGSIDILVNSAGVMYYTMMKNVHLEEWERQVDVNCKGVMNCIGAVLPGMLSQESGHIINISSDAGKRVFPGLSVYSATKFFVEALSQGLRLETANTGIKVTTIQPGSVRTPLFQLSTDLEATKEYGEENEELFLETEDIAKAVLYAVTQPKNCSVNEILIEPRQCPI